MAPSQNGDMETLQYTHKKFNCGYSHKKLGMRLLRRNSQEEEEIQQKHNQETITSRKSTLFRPYALDNTESSKTTIATTPQISQVPEALQKPPNYMQNSQHYMPFYALQQTAQQSEEQYALKLQRQRAVLFMKHVMQFYENGNGWPSVHPHAINNPAFYNNY